MINRVVGHPDATFSSNSTIATRYRSLRKVVLPVVWPVTLTEVKSHCRVDIDDDDAYITGLIAAASTWAEEQTDSTLITTTWEACYDDFPAWDFVLPRPPMRPQAVTITYVSGTNGAETVISSASGQFRTDPYSIPARIYPNHTAAWPVARGDENSVRVRWVAGYGGPSDVPADIKHLVTLLAGHWYESREPVTYGQGISAMDIPYTVKTLLASARWGAYR